MLGGSEMKVVLISPNFFNLSTLIHDEIVRQGNECKWFDDRISSSFITRAVLRLKPSLLKSKILKYFQIISDYCIMNKPDKIICIYGQSFTGERFKQLKQKLPTTEFVFYSWDSAEIYPIIKGKFDVFDRCYSCDTADVEKYKINFLSLFYSYSESLECKKNYDFSFLGTIKKGKYPLVMSINNQLSKKYSSSFVYRYLQSRFVYFYYKLKDPEFKKARRKEFKYKRLPSSIANEIFLGSKIIIDVSRSDQNGLTIRTFDALRLKKKLITNNQNIKKYPFYCPDNIYVYDGGQIDFNSSFFKNGFNEKYALGDEYSLQHFVKILLGGEK